jgi:TRAP-type mannitol/chloroaromatic compound transport system substrate-binding protein
MKRKRYLITLLLLALLSIFLLTSVYAAEKIQWKGQCWVGSTDLAYASFQKLAERIKTATNGRLEIKTYPAGQIVPATEMLDAVQSNVLQCMVGAAIYWSGKDPAFALLGDLTCGWKHPWEADAFFHYYGGMELLEEAYKPFNVHPVGVTWVGLEVMPSRKCVRNLDDFKGLKWRTPSGVPAETFKRFGASPMFLPGGEVFSALEKGIVDGVDWGTPSMNYRLGYHQIAKYFNYPGFHSMATLDFSVNTKAWNELPDDIKSIVEAATREFAWDMVETQAVDSYIAIEKMKKEGVTLCMWSDEEIAKARNIAKGVWKDFGAKGPLAQKVYDAIMKYMDVLGR